MFLIQADKRPTYITWVMAVDDKLGSLVAMLGVEGGNVSERRFWTKGGSKEWGTVQYGAASRDAILKIMAGEAALMKVGANQYPDIEDALAALGLN